MTELEMDRHDIIAQVALFHCLKDPPSELMALFEAFDRTAAQTILEIGTFRGATAAAFGLAFPEAKITTIDLPDTTKTPWNSQPSSEVGKALRELDVKNVWPVRMPSSELGKWVAEGRRYDLVFVDGDHSRAGVLSDLRFAAQLLNPGGVIVAHDYTEPGDYAPEEWRRPAWTIDVYDAVQEFLVESSEFERRRLVGWLVEMRRRV